MKRRTLLAAAATALARPALSQNASRVIRFVPQANLSSPDPIWTTADVTRNHAYLIYDTLYGVDTALTPSPQMCAGHELSDDKLTWRFTLRDGLAFHDGAPVRAADCVASIARWSKRDGFGQILASRLDEMKAVDDKRFELRTKKPFRAHAARPRRELLLHHAGAHRQHRPFQANHRLYRQRPVQVRPGRVDVGLALGLCAQPVLCAASGKPDFSAGAKIVNVDRVEWQIMPDPATAAAALQNGEIDWIEQPLIDLIPMLGRNRDITVRKFDPFGVVGVVVFNHLQPPFDNPKLRRALLPALDQNAYLSAVIGNQPDFKRAGVGVFTPETPLANNAGLETLTAPRDLALAKKLVAESGYKGEKVVLLCPTDYPTLQAVATMTRDLYVQAGLTWSSSPPIGARSSPAGPARGRWRKVAGARSAPQRRAPAWQIRSPTT